VEERGPSVGRTRHSETGIRRPLQPPHPPARGGRGGTDEAAGLQGAAGRRRGARLAGRHVPGSSRGRHIGIVDFDVVDASNLQRQILHNIDRLGESKVESARQTLQALNPDVKIEPYRVRLSADNVLDIMSGYDVVVDGGDNFPTRYLVNDASLHLKIPVVHGAIFRFEGQASVFHPYEGPCYRCLFPQPPPPELAPSCAEAGVLGVLPGIVGSIEAMEAIKLLLGIGDTLVGSPPHLRRAHPGLPQAEAAAQSGLSGLCGRVDAAGDRRVRRPVYAGRFGRSHA
jgi:molybdopterin/thiamine biosynthesis adenylyltransferase